MLEAESRRALLTAALALLAGLVCYLWLRPDQIGPALLLGSGPALTHAFAFAVLLLIAGRPSSLHHRRVLLGVWLALLVTFEALQLPGAKPWMAASVQAVDTWPLALGELLQAHGAGTFDPVDVLASALGVWLAAALIRPASPPATRHHPS